MDRQAFEADPVAAFVDVIRSAGPLGMAGICQSLVSPDLDLDAVKRAWTPAQPKVKTHPNVIVDGRTYQWSDTVAAPPPKPARTVAPRKAAPPKAAPRKPDYGDLRALPPGEALDRFVGTTKLSAPKAALVEAIRAGLTARPDAAPPDAAPEDDALRSAQRRQAAIDGMRAIAELAMEVEELLASAAEPEIVIERLRITAESHSLEPIGQAGEQVAFDPARHSPVAGFPDAGSPVSVIRPGYTWHADGEDVLLGKAVVA